MNDQIKLVAADMDGTLLNSDRKVSEYTQQIIRKVLHQGVHFVAATGRAFNAMPKELETIEKIRYGIFSNGATVYDIREKKVLYKNQFQPKQALELIDFVRQFDNMVSMIHNGQSYGERSQMENIDYYELDTYTREMLISSRKIIENTEEYIKEHDDTVEKVTLVFRTFEEKEKVREALKELDFIQYASSLPKNLEISKKGCNKGDGLLHLTQVLGIGPKETMACGDADNDMEMLQQAGLAIVMENGLDSMKKLADYITVTNNEDGVAKAMEKFVLKRFL